MLQNSCVKIMKQLESFFIEMDESLLKPNIVFMSRESYNILSKEFPYIIKEKKYIRKNDIINIVITEEDYLAVAYAYYFENFNKTEEI